MACASKCKGDENVLSRVRWLTSTFRDGTGKYGPFQDATTRPYKKS